MKEVSTKLVYYFYGDKNFAINRANRIHFNCLSYYCDRFDDSEFYISIDDINNKDLIEEIECSIIRCGYVNAKFNVIENGSYRESIALFDGVINKLEESDGLTFFGHNKGITNYREYSEECIDSWICGLYYLSLENIEDLYGRTINTFFPCSFYGSFLMEKENYDTVRGISSIKTYYAGSFYWINNAEIYNRYGKNCIKIVGRYSAECLPFDLCKDYEIELASYRLFKFNGIDLYSSSALIAIECVLGEEEYNKFNDFYRKMLSFN